MTPTDPVHDRPRAFLQGARREIFGTAQAPFPSRAEAVRWLRRESAAGASVQERSGELSRFKEVFRDLGTRLEAAKDGFPVGMTMRVGLRQELVDFTGDPVPETGQVWVERVLATTPRLVQLAAAARRLAHYTRGSEATATMAILTDRPPATTKLSARRRVLWDHELGSSSDWTLTAMGPLPRDLAALARRFEPKELPPDDKQFLAVVESIGDPPPASKRGLRTGASRFWTRVKDAWNAAYPSDAYATWQGAAYRWRAIRDRQRREPI
jgi:hypothetical protein